MKCWLCGVERDMDNVQTLRDPQPVLIPGMWPAAEDGHQHAVAPPTPGELEQAGHEALSRIQREAWTT